ncbi:MAG: hypothetical protein R3C40_02065 [Parvularculaceae bacterium]
MARYLFATLLAAGAAMASTVATAQAATPQFKSKAAQTVESGVTVWRGARPAPDTPALKGEKLAATPCATQTVEISFTTAWPDRHLRVHGFYSGKATQTPAMKLAQRRATQGFYADRIAAGR